MNIQNIEHDLTIDEGRVKYAYPDSLGYLTIGIGHLIDKRKGGSLPDEIIDALFQYDLKEKINQLDRSLSWWRGTPDECQEVLINMCFNLGINGLLNFKNTLRLIKDEQYSKASVELMNSSAARQLPLRYGRLRDKLNALGDR